MSDYLTSEEISFIANVGLANVVGGTVSQEAIKRILAIVDRQDRTIRKLSAELETAQSDYSEVVMYDLFGMLRDAGLTSADAFKARMAEWQAQPPKQDDAAPDGSEAK